MDLEPARHTATMSGLFHFLQSQPFFVIFGVVAVGMALGKVAIRGIALGSVVCIILAGLLASIWAYNSSGISLALPDILKTVFFNLFIFAVGVKIGPQFFAGLERDGWHMVAIGLIVAVLAPLLSYRAAGFSSCRRARLPDFWLDRTTRPHPSERPRRPCNLCGPSGAGSLGRRATGTLSAAFALCYTVSEVQFVLFMKWLPGRAKIDNGACRGTRVRSVDAFRYECAAAGDAGGGRAGGFLDRGSRVPGVSASSIAGRTIAEIRQAAPRVSIELGAAWRSLADGRRHDEARSRRRGRRRRATRGPGARTRGARIGAAGRRRTRADSRSHRGRRDRATRGRGSRAAGAARTLGPGLIRTGSFAPARRCR